MYDGSKSSTSSSLGSNQAATTHSCVGSVCERLYNQKEPMKQRYRCLRRENGIYYALDALTKKRQSLNTTTLEEARRLLSALNEACKQPAVNLQIAQVYLQHSDPDYAKRTWWLVMDRMGEMKTGNTLKRWNVAVKDRAFDAFRDLALIKTPAELFLEALHKGSVSTNVFLRRIHNFALDMDWIPKAIIPKRQWPKIEFNAKRAITQAEHQSILAQEKNPEYYAYYEMLWHLGGSQSDIANLCAENVNWEDRTVAYFRMKTGSRVMFHFGESVVEILKSLPQRGVVISPHRQITGGGPGNVFQTALRTAGYFRCHTAFISVCVGATGEGVWLPGAFCTGSAAPDTSFWLHPVFLAGARR